MTGLAVQEFAVLTPLVRFNSGAVQFLEPAVSLLRTFQPVADEEQVVSHVFLLGSAACKSSTFHIRAVSFLESLALELNISEEEIIAYVRRSQTQRTGRCLFCVDQCFGCGIQAEQH